MTDMKFIVYLLIGGTAALVEWGLFYVFNVIWDMNYLVAVIASFVVSTLYHYILTTMFVFKSGAKYKRSTELSLVFIVSVMGLIFNLILMYLFVSQLALNAMISKIMASCIVVAWNYLARKKWIF